MQLLEYASFSLEFEPLKYFPLKELIKMMPVRGKSSSMSLRLSSTLMYGTSVALRIKTDQFLMEVTRVMERAGGRRRPPKKRTDKIDLSQVRTCSLVLKCSLEIQ